MNSVFSLAVNYNVESIPIVMGARNGGFSSLTSYSVGFSLYGTATADFNKDGIQDIVTPNWGTMTVSTLLGNGDGIFKPAVSYNSGSQPSGVKAADLNSDGNQDIVIV
ncbi:MAG: VCBS repeat-containing protein [Candidatus Midichloria sp.]|nr:VCBS repeat-containing protein [Candidatus Midichloria sp.]